MKIPNNFPDLIYALETAMRARSIRSEEACYLFEAYDAVPDVMPEGILSPGEDWTSLWCEACAETIFNSALSASTKALSTGDGNAAAGEEVYVHHSNDSGEGPRHCARCGVYIREGFTECSIDDVLHAWEGKRLTPDCLPEICEGLEFYGNSLPFSCGACEWNAPFRPRWKPPVMGDPLTPSHWGARASLHSSSVVVQCCGCKNTVRRSLREARDIIRNVQRWKAFRALAQRAYRRFCGECYVQH